jgi:hypothetical protein
LRTGSSIARSAMLVSYGDTSPYWLAVRL